VEKNNLQALRLAHLLTALQLECADRVRAGVIKLLTLESLITQAVLNFV
jgi:hypothetical protein